MSVQIRLMVEEDRECVQNMMRVFYASPAVLSNGSDDIFCKDIDYCIWIEDLYMKEEYRGLGIGTQFFEYIEKRYPDALIRLEVEEENKRAIHVYQKCGYEILPYLEMKK